MKCTIEYNLPEESEDYNNALKGSDYLYAVQDFDNYLRSELKYNDSLSEEQCHLIQTVRSKLHACFEDHGASVHG